MSFLQHIKTHAPRLPIAPPAFHVISIPVDDDLNVDDAGFLLIRL